MSTEETEAPNWLLKLEEQRERRLKVRLGHEAGAGAKCQKCEDKCPGLDLHFWRKICKACKCGKEDHDIIDDDIYGFVQFTLLGSKPVKSKGQFLKDRKDEVILEWTPKGSSNDIKKYLEELPPEMVPVKGSEGAKIRKQRLQKQMPAHDIDASLCHQLTEDEIKEMEEYVSHIRKNCVGQGKIIRLSLFKGAQHKIPPNASQLLTQFPPTQIASSQNVLLQSSDISNNLQNLNLRDRGPQAQDTDNTILPNPSEGATKSQKPYIPNYNPQNSQQTIDNQIPVLGKLTDRNYYPSGPQNTEKGENFVHPLTTTNVERHQEQFEIQNANFERITNPHLNFAPNYLNPVEQHQLPAQVGHSKDLKYPTSQFEGQNIPRYNNANVETINNPLMNFNPNYVNPISETQLPTQVGQPKDLKYPQGTKLGGQNEPNDNLNYPPINNSTHPLMQQNQNNLVPKGQIGTQSEIGATQEGTYPFNVAQTIGSNSGKNIGQKDKLNYPISNNANVPLQNYNPNFVHPVENVQLPVQIGHPQDISYPKNMPPNVGQSLNQNLPQNVGPNIGQNIGQNLGHNVGQNLGQNVGQNLGHNVGQNLSHNVGQNIGQNKDKLNYPTANNSNNPLQQYNPNFVHPVENVQLPAHIGASKDLKYAPNIAPNNLLNPNHPSGFSSYPNELSSDFSGGIGPNQGVQIGQNSINANPLPLGDNVGYPNPQLGGNIDPEFQNTIDATNMLRNKPLIPILEAQNAINPLETLQNLSSVGYLHDLDYPVEKQPLNLKEMGKESPDVNSNLAPRKCHACGGGFEEDGVAVSADRSASLWHSKCFNCESCKQPLADLLYFYHKETDNIYCGRDYAILKGIPRCLACDELIFVREYCLAEDNTFHIKHFCCFECDEPLAGKQYIIENAQPVCVTCYENLKSENCTDCNLKIKPDEQGVSLQNLHWHASPECFACKECRKSLLGHKMLLKNQHLFCSDICYKGFQNWYNS